MREPSAENAGSVADAVSVVILASCARFAPLGAYSWNFPLRELENHDLAHDVHVRRGGLAARGGRRDPGVAVAHTRHGAVLSDRRNLRLSCPR